MLASREEFKNLPAEARADWIELSLRLCEIPELLSWSEHLLYIDKRFRRTEMTLSEAREKLKRLELEEFAYGYAMGALHYDGNTGAPRDNYIPRGKALSVLSAAGYELSTGERGERILDTLSAHLDELTTAERRSVELRRKDLLEMRSIPQEEFVAFRELLNEAHIVRTEAKERDDFASFEPVLQRIIEANRRFAALAAPDMDPYDYCLDKYEEGLTMERCDRFFGVLRDRLVPLIERVGRAEAPDTSMLELAFPVDAQEKLAYRLMDVMGIDKNRCRLGTTEHPFTMEPLQVRREDNHPLLREGLCLLHVQRDTRGRARAL